MTQASFEFGDPSLSVAPAIADTLLGPIQSLEMTVVWTPAVGASPLDSHVSVNMGNRSAQLVVTGGLK